MLHKGRKCSCKSHAEHIEFLQLVRNPYTKNGWRRMMEELHNG